MIGFKPQAHKRITIRNEQGGKVGYLASVDGRQIFQSEDGKPIAFIKTFKRDAAPFRQGAQGGSFASPDYW